MTESREEGRVTVFRERMRKKNLCSDLSGALPLLFAG